MTCTLYLVVSTSLLSDSLSGAALPRFMYSLLSLMFLLPCLLLTDLRSVSTLSLLCSLAHVLIRWCYLNSTKSQPSRPLLIFQIKKVFFSLSLVILFQPLGHAVLYESSQQLVMVLSAPLCGPWGLPRLCGCHHLFLHLADLPPSSRGQHGGQGAV